MQHLTLRALLASIVLVALGASGCEETVDITDATYRERLVVYSVLDAGDSIDVSMTRTLPLNEPYSEQKAALADVDATITATSPSGVVTRHQLSHRGGGHYRADGLVATAGWRYQFAATWHGKSVTASTLVPTAPTIDTLGVVPSRRHYVEIPDSAFTVRAVVRPSPGSVYLITTATVDPRTGNMHIYDTYGSAPLVRLRDTTDAGLLVLVDEWGYFERNQPIGAAIVTYDEQYYEFQRTYYNGHDSGPFGSGSDTVWWTVKGDGLGLFIGRRMDMVRVR